MIVVGVDGGGTRSRALVVAEGDAPLGAADGGPGIILPGDPLAAAAAVEEVVRRALERSGVNPPVDALWAGLAGAGRRTARERVTERLRAADLAHRVAVGLDVEAGHADAFAGGPGVLIVIGTGSIVYGVDPRGDSVTVGGWGMRLGDEGSGYRVGMDGLRAVVRSADGREAATGLTDLLLTELGLLEPRLLLDWTGHATKGQIAALSPLVVEAGRGGDVVAARIVHEALGEIRTMLQAAMDRTGGWTEAPGLALVGGLLKGEREFRLPVTEIGAELGYRVLKARVVPERGAALKARGLAS